MRGPSEVGGGLAGVRRASRWTAGPRLRCPPPETPSSCPQGDAWPAPADPRCAQTSPIAGGEVGTCEEGGEERGRSAIHERGPGTALETPSLPYVRSSMVLARIPGFLASFIPLRCWLSRPALRCGRGAPALRAGRVLLPLVAARGWHRLAGGTDAGSAWIVLSRSTACARGQARGQKPCNLIANTF